MRVPGLVRALAADSPLPVTAAGRAAVRAAEAGAGGIRAAASLPLPGMGWGMGRALSLPVRPVGLAVSAAGRAASVTAPPARHAARHAAIATFHIASAATPPYARRAAAAVLREGASVAANAGAFAAMLADIGPARTRRHTWSRDGRAHVEVRGLTGRGPAHRRLAADITTALTALKGVRWAEVNAATAHVVVVFDEGETALGDLVDAVESVERAHGVDTEDFPWDRSQHPADDAPAAAAATALAADCLGIVAALTGRLARLGAPPRALRAPLALLDAQPRTRPALARHLGPHGADLVIAVSNVVSHGLTRGEMALATDAMQRLLRLGELKGQRAVWERREEELHSGGHGLPAERHSRSPRPRPLPRGPVENVADKTSLASLAGGAGILAFARDPGKAADAILATVPKAARLGREGFCSMLGRELAGRGAVALDGTALRRLDRITAVVIDSDVLCLPLPQILSAVSSNGQLSDAEVWQRAERVLRGHRAAQHGVGPPWANGRWRLTRPAGGSSFPAWDPSAMALELVDEHGGRYGRVRVGLELDPLADPVLAAAREAAPQVLLTEHESATGLVSAADSVLPGTGGLAQHVRRLQADGEVVLTVSAGDDEALDAADVGACVVSASHRVSWSADLVCGPGLEDVWRVLQATAAARQVSQRSARLSVGGSAIGALLVTAGPGTRRQRGGLAPVHSAALIALFSGAASARSVARRRGPAPMPRGNWHAIPAEDALARLRETATARATAPTRPPARATGIPGAVQALISAAASPARPVLEFASVVRDELNDPLAPILALGAVASAAVGSGVDAVLVGSVMTGNALISGSQRMRAERALRRLLIGEEVTARRVILPPPRAGHDDGAPSPDPRGDGAAPEMPANGARPSDASGDGPSGDGPFAALPGAPTEPTRAGDLAVGDIIRLHPADVVPADARLLLADDLEVDESTLTGESVPVPKSPGATPGAPLAERTCMLYEGTSVLAGTAHAVVTANGEATEAGRAAGMAARAAPPTGLQARLAELTRIALPATGLGGLAVTGMGLLRRIPLREAITSGVAVAVAAVPEGLPLVATISELAAARRLSGRRVLVRSARALEALGRVDTVCFDKTGTLTEGRIAVARLALPGAEVPFGSALGRHVLHVAARACPQGDGGAAGRLTHATDRAVVEAAHRYPGADPAWRLTDELPFETSRGYSASIGEERGRTVLAVKGAPEVVLAQCTAITVPPDGADGTAGPDSGGTAGPDSGATAGPDSGATAGPDGGATAGPDTSATAGLDGVTGLTPARRRQAQALVRDLAADGLRVLAVAEASQGDLAERYRRSGGRLADVVGRLTLAGFLAFADTSRPSAEEAVRRLKESGVRVVMITGDHPVTATAIASQIGIPEAGKVLAGPEMAAISEAESTALIDENAVFARISPEQKVQIVRSLQRAGHVVAMTGDGTNDAAAIRVADVGVGVSARGSTSARSSADLVLTEPDPTRICDALLEGRALWASARDAVSILIGGNAGEVAFMLLGTALTGRAPLTTRQLLLVNLLTDMLPALAVALAPASPADGNGSHWAAGGPVSSFMGSGLLREVGVRGGTTALGGLAAWLAGLVTGTRTRANTIGLAAVVLTELGQTLHANWRSPLVVATSAVSAAVLACIIQAPGVSQFFGCTPLGPLAWAIAAGSAVGATLAAAFAPRLLQRFTTPGEAARIPA